MKNSDRQPLVIFMLAMIVISVCYYSGIIGQYPNGIHSWAQSDRLSLAIQFYDHGMNLFMPRTFSITAGDNFTGVEFPIQAYIAAAIGKIFGRNSISIAFRLLDTIISIIGFWFLFKAVFKRTQDYVISFFPVVFIFCSPVFIYYTCSYMPDTASASLAFMSFYFLLEYMDKPNNKHAIIALLLLILGTLIKTSAIIYFGGALSFILIQKFFTEEKFKITSYLPVMSVALAGLYVIYKYFQYNNVLNAKYNSGIFLAAAKPFHDLDALKYYLTTQLMDVWIGEYFLMPEYYMLFLLIIVGFIFIRKQPANKKQLLLAMFFVYLSIIIGYLMGAQFMAHDYYVIVIFYPTILFIVTVFTIAIQKGINNSKALKPVRILFGTASVVLLVMATIKIHQRYRPDYEPFHPGRPWMENDTKLFDNMGVPKSERILVLNEEPTNLALLYFDRTGFCMSKERWNNDVHNITSMMDEKNLTLLVMQKKYVEEMKAVDSAFAPHFKFLKASDSSVVYRYVK
ncbi:MAG: glycosyltransferase family 39 protein [Bacteroidetes bacterium]|nr:glycosyltransferase family 39 protein [Bacteroidota bacterium]